MIDSCVMSLRAMLQKGTEFTFVELLYPMLKKYKQIISLQH